VPKDFNRESAAGAALPESDVHYPLIAEAATDAIITIDSDSTILVSPPRKIFAAGRYRLCSNAE
jgi:hypothetical protein